jgi:hypothetical protein
LTTASVTRDEPSASFCTPLATAALLGLLLWLLDGVLLGGVDGLLEAETEAEPPAGAADPSVDPALPQAASSSAARVIAVAARAVRAVIRPSMVVSRRPSPGPPREDREDNPRL